ncbi:MAG TPA: sialidase family protein [Polyangia bacterium]|nr:sialidase family protein [Polyangia bacterium]
MWLHACAIGALLAGGGPLAWGNGAFPDSQSILLPLDRPMQVGLATNFGLILSEDGGKTWVWSCEQPTASYGILYQLGPTPMDRLYALSEAGLIRSDDQSCTWSVAGGMAAKARLTDLFPDQTNAMRLLVLGIPNTTTTTLPPAAYESLDSGQTVSPPLYQGAVVDTLTGIESARTDPNIIYIASYDATGPHPKLSKSTDSGMTWTTLDVEPSLGSSTFRIITIDVADAAKIYLLVTETQSQSLAISTDGGMTFTKPVHFNSSLTAFARLASGTILVAGQDIDDATGNLVGAGYRSSDGGKTFTPWKVPQLRALAERDGKLYGAADNFNDGFALGVSADEGITFQPILKYSDVSSIQPCVQQVCLDNCHLQALQGLWPDSICGGPASDGGVDAAADAATKATSSGGGGCTVGGQIAALRWVWLGLLAAAVPLSRMRRRRPPGASASISSNSAGGRAPAKRKGVD